MLAALTFSDQAWAIDCESVAGHIAGMKAKATRHAEMRGSRLTVTGKIGTKDFAVRDIPCVALAKGVLCEKTVGTASISITTNGNRMIESITDTATGVEQAGYAYACNGGLKL